MKTCDYCGHENEEGAIHCSGCGTSEFVDKQGGASEAELEGLGEEVLPRDRPKAVIVAGTWLIYGSGLIVNLLVLLLAMTRRFEALAGVFWFFGSLAGAGLCTYLLYRSLKNYNIQKRREAEESSLFATQKVG